MTDQDFQLDLGEVSSAEDFLDHFGIEYEPAVVHVNRLHILQRFHDYLAGVEEMPADAVKRRALHADLLALAYQDFVTSDAATEKVFRVFHMNVRHSATVDLSDLTNQLSHAP